MNQYAKATVPTRRATRGRAARSMRHLWQVPTFLLGLFCFLGVALSAPMRQESSRTAVTLRANLTDFRKKLERGTNLEELKVHAELLAEEAEKQPRRAGEIHYVVGTLWYRLAEQDLKNPRYPKLAIAHLEQARNHAIASDEYQAATFRLGAMYLRDETQLKKAIDFIRNGVERGSDSPIVGYELLTEAYLKLPEPNVEGALRANQKHLELLDDPNAIAKARLTRVDLLLRSEQRAEAIRELERVSGKIAREHLVKSRLLLAKFAEEDSTWNRAASLLKELLPDAALVPGGRTWIQYKLGHCLASGDPPSLTQAAKAWEEIAGTETPEGQAALFRLGELRLFGLEYQPDLALEEWGQALAKVRTPGDYRNKLFDLNMARATLELGCRHFLDSYDFARTQKLADLYKRISSPGMAEEKLALAAEALAKNLEKSARHLPPTEKKRRLEEARSEYHRAGVAFEQAAMARPLDEQLEPLWRSSRSYRAAEDSVRMIAVLERAVRLSKDETQLAQAWLDLAESFEKLGQKERSLKAYYKCIEYPFTPFAYRARYRLALAEWEQTNHDQAVAILEQNLKSVSPTADRDAQEKSIYQLAWWLSEMKQLEKAWWYMKEATRQYPNHPQWWAMREQLGDSCRKLAESAGRKAIDMETAALERLPIEQRGAVEEAKAFHRRTQRDWLEKSVDAYQRLADDLETKAKRRDVTQEDLLRLRKSLFAVADIRFELNEHAEALRRYMALHERYRKKVEGLVACQRIWRCVGVMIDTPDHIKLVRQTALNAVQNSRSDLEEMAADSDGFRGAGVWSKSEWQNWLDWVHRQLTQTVQGTPTNVLRPRIPFQPE
jgi:hypothetical protein